MMKKLILSTFLIFTCSMMFAQSNTSFGLSAGYANVDFRGRYDGATLSSTESGFYAGGLVDFTVAGSFHIQPEALFTLAEGRKFIAVPVLAKWYIGDTGFQLMAGPQANFHLEDNEFRKSFGLDATFGIAYDISEHFFINARYAIELTDRLKNGYGSNQTGFGNNTFYAGIGYKF